MRESRNRKFCAVRRVPRFGASGLRSIASTAATWSAWCRRAGGAARLVAVRIVVTLLRVGVVRRESERLRISARAALAIAARATRTAGSATFRSAAT